VFVLIEEQVIEDLKDFSNKFKVSHVLYFCVVLCCAVSAHWGVMVLITVSFHCLFVYKRAMH